MVFHLCYEQPNTEDIELSRLGTSGVPTYDYKCEACDHLWEEFQSIKAEPIKKCPKCGKSKARRQIGGGAGLIFKGSGFYLTDYRSDSYKKAAAADKQAVSGGDSAAKSDASPAPKSDTGKKSAE